MELKRLPRDEKGEFARTFTAAGNTYIVLSQAEGIGINRYSKLMQISSTITFDMDVGTQVKNWKVMDKLLSDFARGASNMSAIGAHIQNVLDGIRRSSDRNYLFSFWACTLFIVREGEDITKWVEEEQKEKIDDWATEGFHESEFHELVKKKLLEFSAE